MIFLDISKAFDKVFHEGILYKLESFGVRGKLLTWFESNLSNRQQRVIVDSLTSEYKSTNAGVPQGSILGPILFLIFINDFPDKVKSDTFMFADDTSLMRTLTHMLIYK